MPWAKTNYLGAVKNGLFGCARACELYTPVTSISDSRHQDKTREAEALRRIDGHVPSATGSLPYRSSEDFRASSIG
jgi:hypothetical protein